MLGLAANLEAPAATVMHTGLYMCQLLWQHTLVHESIYKYNFEKHLIYFNICVCMYTNQMILIIVEMAQQIILTITQWTVDSF